VTFQDKKNPAISGGVSVVAGELGKLFLARQHRGKWHRVIVSIGIVTVDTKAAHCGIVIA